MSCLLLLRKMGDVWTHVYMFIFVIPDDIESWELEDYIANIMDAEFNTVTDDGSLPEVSGIFLEQKYNIEGSNSFFSYQAL